MIKGLKALDKVAIKVLANIEPQTRFKVLEVNQESDSESLSAAIIAVLFRSGVTVHPPE